MTPRDRAFALLRCDATLATYQAALAILSGDDEWSSIIRRSMAAAIRHVSFAWSLAVGAGGSA